MSLPFFFLPESDPRPKLPICLHRLTGTPWIIGGDLATLYPFLAFRLPHVSYARRWLTVDADDTRKKGGGGGPRLHTHTSNGSIGGGSHESSDSLDGFTDCGLSSTADGGDGEEDERVGTDADDKEAVALDIALPEKGLDPAKPFYLVLHGLTGGSAEVCVRLRAPARVV